MNENPTEIKNGAVPLGFSSDNNGLQSIGPNGHCPSGRAFPVGKENRKPGSTSRPPRTQVSWTAAPGGLQENPHPYPTLYT